MSYYTGGPCGAYGGAPFQTQFAPMNYPVSLAPEPVMTAMSPFMIPEMENAPRTVVSDIPPDPLDLYHRNLLFSNAVPLEHAFGLRSAQTVVPKGHQVPLEKVPEVLPGSGWFTGVPLTFRYIPNDRIITDERGMPVLRIFRNCESGIVLFDLNGTTLAKSSGYQSTCWNIEVPTMRGVLRRDQDAFGLGLYTYQKVAPFVDSASCILKLHCGSLLHPVDTACVTSQRTRENIAIIHNESGFSLHQAYSITIDSHNDALLYLLMLCHAADFVLEHCSKIDKTTRVQQEKDCKDLDRLQKQLGKKWGFQPQAAVYCHPHHTPQPYSAQPSFTLPQSNYISQPDAF